MDAINWIIFGPAKLIAQLPYAGFMIAAMLIGIQAVRTILTREVIDKQWFRKASVFAGLLWAIFNLYEVQVAAALTSSIHASKQLRLDLIVLTPLLYVLTTFAAYSLLFPVRLKMQKEHADSSNIR